MDIFTIVGPIMIGPSSSHTAGACRIGNIASKLLGAPPKKAEITLYGSFAKTGAGHGTDKAIVAGLLGLGSDDMRIKNAFDYAREAGLEFAFECEEKAGIHSNTVKIVLCDKSGTCISMVGSSVGGGRVKIEMVNDFEAGFDGESHTVIAVHSDRPGVIAYVTEILAVEGVNIAKMSTHRTKRGGIAALIIESDQAPSGESINKIKEHDLVQRIYVVPKVEG